MKKFSLLICALMASVALYAQNGHLVLSTPEVDVEYRESIQLAVDEIREAIASIV